MTTEEMITVMQASLRGEKIQFHDVDARHDIWEDCLCEPSWAWNKVEYRIKPAERKPREWWLIPASSLGSSTMLGTPVKPLHGDACYGDAIHVREVIE